MTHILKWSALLVVAITFAFANFALAEGDWKLVQSKERDFSILMPASVKSVDKNVKNVTINAFTADENNTNYSITHAAGIQATPTAIDSIGEGAISEFKKQAQALGVSLNVDKTEESNGEGWAGKKTYMSIGSAKLQMIAALSENKNVGYCLIAASQDGSSPNPSFFTSFKVDTKITNSIHPNKASNLGEFLGRFFGIVAGGGLAFFIAHKIKQKNNSVS